MAAPINMFELTESVRFFASLAGTPGISQDNVDLSNQYINVLLKSMESSVKDTAKVSSASSAGLVTNI